MRCVECFMRDGGKWTEADFVINGQSVCQKHAHVVIRDRGAVTKTYTWPPEDADIDEEPRLEP